MNTFSKTALASIAALTLMACTGSNQQPVTTAPMGQTVAVDSTQALPAAAPVDSAAQTAPAASPQAQQLPEAINTFLQKTFPGAAVSYVELDNEYGGVNYDVKLNDGTEIDFDANNQWDKVDCHVKAVPASLVPAAIAQYVKANYQGLPITKIDKEPYGYEIELSNGLDIKFNPSGQMMGIDD